MNDNRFYPLFLLISLSLFLSLKYVSGSTSGFNNGSVKCIERERQALLKFKLGLVDDSGLLSSWDNKDCCKWWGVKCNNTTGHVTVLNLQGDPSSWADLRGEVSLSVLIGLQHLRYLDLSFHNFTGSQLGEAIGSFHRLKYLKLSYSGFGGAVPHQLGNLSNLQSLDLRWNGFTGAVPHQLGNLSNLQSLDLMGNYGLITDNLVWLSQLRLLRQLDLSEINLNITNWMQVIFNLPFLEELHLAGCELGGHATPSLPLLLNSSSSKSLFILDLYYNHLTSPSTYYWLFNISKNLVSIDLNDNDLEGPIPDAFGEMISLNDIYMSFNHLIGGIPKSFQNLSHLRSLVLQSNDLSEPFPELLQKLSKGAESSLEELDLRGNQFYGPFTGITRFVSLRKLDLGYNRFTGSLPVNIGQFSKLEFLDISSNLLKDTISEVHLSNLSSLKYLFLSFNSLTFNISPKWVPPFQLDTIELTNCSVGPHFPQWLRTQTNLSWLDLSVNGISEVIPNWFWNFSLKFRYLNLSYNQISGSLPEFSPKFDSFPTIDLSCNNFSGPILSVPHNLLSLNLHKNMFTGPVSFLCVISGRLFRSLDLSNNLFSGDIPNCWMNMTELIVLDLANNQFSGPIPESLGFLREVQTLQLHNNHFVGEIPSSVRNCGQLQLIDVGENSLTGSIPSWIGIFLTNLAFLSLRSNKIYGNIPQNICHLSNIQVLDLSHNNISGAIPQCFNNFTNLVQKISPSSNTAYSVYGYVVDTMMFFGPSQYMDNMWVQWKRYDSEYNKILGQLKAIDLSDNKLVGQIPKEIASLRGLISLNLSVNHLTGNIVSHIDQMEMLESLDLSRNQLSGEIPLGLARLHFLAVLDLSYNNLSGKIPSSTQLQSFDPSAYIGNNGLCGLPLDRCPSDDNDSRPTDHGKDEDGLMSKDKEFYMVMGLGFLVGLWGVVVVLFKNSWRNAYFTFLKYACDWFYVRSMVYWLRLKRMVISD